MPRDDITQLLADNLGNLPHPDGRPRLLMHYRHFGLPEDKKHEIKGLTADIAVCVQHLLEEHGYTISHKGDVKPADIEDYKTAHIKCACGRHLLDLNVNPDMETTLGKAARTYAATRLHSDCPHD